MTQPFLARRTALKGLGVSLALPLLEAMLPQRGFAAQDGSIPRRLGFVFFPNGAIMRKWTPAMEGAGYELTPSLLPLAKVRQKISILTGLMHDNANEKGDGAGDHARSASAFLTGAHPRKQGDLQAGVSVDQLAAMRFGQLTRLRSLELGTEPNRTPGQCDSGYSCAYSSNISWKSASTPMAKEINPKLAFTRMFSAKANNAQEAVKRDFYRKSILDSVLDEAARLQTKVGQADRNKLDEYFNSVREIEVRIAQTQNQPRQRALPEIKLPSGIPNDIDEHIRLMFDLLVVAFQSDTTRVATYMIANEGSDRQYRMVGVQEGHHILSHHKNKPETMDAVQKIDRYLVSRFAAFLENLDGIREGDGTLLDHSMIVYGCAIGDGNTHNHESLPVVLAGRGGGTLNTGRHVTYPKRTPMNNLFLSLLERVGVQEQRFGDSTGRLGRL
jgi:hypothetical protein